MNNIINNSSDIKIPYSAKAVEELLALENKHKLWYLSNSSGDWTGAGWCKDCYSRNLTIWDSGLPNNGSDEHTRCKTLLNARKMTSKETIIAVALLLSERI